MSATAVAVDFETLTRHTHAFLRTLHILRPDFGLKPKKEHVAACLNYVDLQEMRDRFVVELVGTAITFVYSKAKQEEIVKKLQDEGRDLGGAMTQLFFRAKAKFRPSSLRGQFTELILCNLLQYFFKAVPLLRKMPITTNPELERNGSDAIHVTETGGTYKIYLGEAKTYDRKEDSLKDALHDAAEDLLKEHYANHRRELNLYTFEDFLPPELEAVANGYLDGTLANVEVHLVCIAAYGNRNAVLGASKADILKNEMEGIVREATAAFDVKFFKELPEVLLPRLNYIVFSMRELNDLIDRFRKVLGHGS